MIVKVCGLREADNIRAVEAVGADWAGFIFHPRSPRYVAVPPAYLPRCRRVGVFVNAGAADILRRVAGFGLSAVQLHGDEAPSLCAALRARGLTVIKAFPVATEESLAATVRYAGACDYFLFDTPTALRGGSGRPFRWELLQAYAGPVPFLLSGGLSPAALPALCAFRHPCWAGVDLNSGFELAPGRKDAARLALFIHSLRENLKNRRI